MISVNNLGIEFGGEPLFANATFNINPKDRIGLTGKNGTGKTTLMKIISGETKSSFGEVVIPETATLGYLAQEMSVNSKKPVIEETLDVFGFLDEIKNRLDEITHLLSTTEDYSGRQYLKILEEQETLLEQLRLSEPEKLRGDAEKVLAGLGFLQKDLNRPLEEFSMGWRMRVELAKLLLLKPTLLMLDEPTNHLDIESIQWLEDYLQTYKGAIMLVSHDRTLLDNLTNRTIEINNGKLYDYKVSYSNYIELREERLAHQQAAFNNQQKQVRQIERFVERFRYKSTKARQVQSRVKMLEKLDKVDVDDLDQSAIHFTFPPAPHSGKITVEGRQVSKKYDDKLVLDKIDFQILKGEKVAFVGKNGEGKTTLAKMISNQLSYQGEIKPGHNVILGYFAQDQWEMLDSSLTVFETVDHVAVGDIRKRLKTILGAFLFQGEDVDKKVSILSGGEKARLALAKLLLTPSNLLILDEPTNHLDILSKDILKNALLQFTGTLIIVSHDRDFLQGLTSRTYEFSNKKINEYLGDIFEYIEKRKIKQLKDLERKQKNVLTTKAGPSKSKLQWEQKKESERQARKLKAEILKTEDEIEKLETEMALINQKLSNPEKYAEDIKSGKLYKAHDRTNKSLEEKLYEWEVLHTRLDDLI